MRANASALVLLLLSATALAQETERVQPGIGDPLRPLEETAPADSPSSSLEIAPRQKMTFGEGGYVSGDTSLFLQLPLGFSTDLGYSFYRTDDSSASHTASFGGGKEWDSRFVGFTYTVTPWSNDYRSDAVNVSVSMRSGPAHLRTTLGADVTVTHHTQVIRGANQARRYDVTQRSPTFTVRQQLWDTRLSVDLSESTYNKDLLILSRELAVATARRPRLASSIGGASGLLQGFQDRSMRFGVSHDLEAWSIPLTPWASYESTHFVDTFQSPDTGVLVFVRGQTADTQSYGVDAELNRVLDASIGFKRIRQTNYPTRDYFSLALGLRL